MGKTKRFRKVLLTCISAAMLLLLAVCVSLMDSITLVSDSSLQAVLTGRQVLKLRLGCMAKGYRLGIKVLDDSAFLDSGLFTSAIEKLGSDIVLFGPLSMAYASANGIDLSSMLAESMVFGIGNNGEKLVDCLLVSDVSSGWIMVADKLAQEMSTTSRNVAVVYESSDKDLVQDIVSCFPYGSVSTFEHSSSSGFHEDSLKAMDRLGIVVAMCPWVSDMNRFFLQDSSLQWVVDYRFRSVVPESQLYGVVSPDFLSVLDLECVKGSHLKSALRYDYEKR